MRVCVLYVTVWGVTGVRLLAKNCIHQVFIYSQLSVTWCDVIGQYKHSSTVYNSLPLHATHPLHASIATSITISS